MNKKIILFTILSFIFIFKSVTAEATCYNLSYSTKFGMRDSGYSNSVSSLQKFLREFNYLVNGPAGYFGGQTLTAVKNFQRLQGLPQTGFAGPMTRAKIKSLSCGPNATTPIQDPYRPIVGPRDYNPVIPVNPINDPAQYPAYTFITITSPNTSSAITKSANPYIIRWNSNNLNNTYVNIYLLNSDGSSYYIANVRGGDNSYAWTIPSSIPAKDGYRIRIFSDTVSDYSDTYFPIREGTPLITVTNPVSSSVWNLDSNQSQNITWTYQSIDANQTATIYLSFPDSSRCKIGTASINSQSFPITLRNNSCIDVVKNIVPGKYYIGVSAVGQNNNTITDYTDQSFTITSNATDPTLMKVLSPNGGENVTATESTTITWSTPTSLLTTDTVSLDLQVYTSSSDTAYKTIRLATNIANTKSYSWIVPSSLGGVLYNATDRYKILLSTAKNTTFTDTSDNFFTINPVQRIITVTAPTQASIARDTDFTVSWNKVGFLSGDKINISFSPVGSSVLTTLRSNVTAKDGTANVRIPLGTSLNSYKITLSPVGYTFGTGSVVASSLFSLTNKTGGAITLLAIPSPAYRGETVKAKWSTSNITGSNMTVKLVTSAGAAIAGIPAVSVPVLSLEKDILIPYSLPAGSYKIVCEGTSDGAVITASTNEFTIADPVYAFSLSAEPATVVKNTNATISWTGAHLKSADTVTVLIKDSVGNRVTGQGTFGAGSISLNIPSTFASGTATIYATTTAVGYTRSVVTSSRAMTITNPIVPTVTVLTPTVNSTTTMVVDTSWSNNNFNSNSAITSLRVSLVQKKGSVVNTTLIESGLSPSTTALRIPIASGGTIGTLQNVGIDHAFSYQIKVEVMAGTSVVATGLTSGVFYILK